MDGGTHGAAFESELSLHAVPTRQAADQHRAHRPGEADRDRVLVVSSLPGFTAKWLAPRLYRFAAARTAIGPTPSASLSSRTTRVAAS